MFNLSLACKIHDVDKLRRVHGLTSLLPGINISINRRLYILIEAGANPFLIIDQQALDLIYADTPSSWLSTTQRTSPLRTREPAAPPM
jgi:hypothetical protein